MPVSAKQGKNWEMPTEFGNVEVFETLAGLISVEPEWSRLKNEDVTSSGRDIKWETFKNFAVMGRREIGGNLTFFKSCFPPNGSYKGVFSSLMD